MKCNFLFLITSLSLLALSKTVWAENLPVIDCPPADIVKNSFQKNPNWSTDHFAKGVTVDDGFHHYTTSFDYYTASTTLNFNGQGWDVTIENIGFKMLPQQARGISDNDPAKASKFAREIVESLFIPETYDKAISYLSLAGIPRWQCKYGYKIEPSSTFYNKDLDEFNEKSSTPRDLRYILPEVTATLKLK